MVRRERPLPGHLFQRISRRVAGLSKPLSWNLASSPAAASVFFPQIAEWQHRRFRHQRRRRCHRAGLLQRISRPYAYILKHCGAKVVFVVARSNCKKFSPFAPVSPTWNKSSSADGGPNVPSECLRYETLIANAGAVDISSYRMRASQVLPGQLASLIYTSATTGEPKG